jgi:hypothetical protein
MVWIFSDTMISEVRYMEMLSVETIAGDAVCQIFQLSLKERFSRLGSTFN